MSWLGFNFRVLQEAADEKVALFERMKFLSIFSSNLDEFFRVRYPAVLALSRLNEKTRVKAGIKVTDPKGQKVFNRKYQVIVSPSNEGYYQMMEKTSGQK